MIKKHLSKIIALGIIAVSLIAFNPTGAYANARWRNDSVGWWYMQDDGWGAKGWIQTNGKWYYLGTDGYMKTGWQQYNGQWYYLNSDGSMATNTTIDGYQIDNSGVWVQDSIITLDQAKQIALNKVKTVRYPNSSVNVIIIPYVDIVEEVIEGRSGYLITLGEDNSEHTVVTERVFVDKNTGEVFDASDVVLDIGDKKLKELK